MFYFTNSVVRHLAEQCARGTYQRALVDGQQRASGSDIKGKWRSSYHDSRQAFISRMKDSGICVAERKVGRRKFLVCGTSPEQCESIAENTLDSMWV